MKTSAYKKITLFTLLILSLLSTKCVNDLEEVPSAQYSPDNFLNSEKGLNTLLVSAYGQSQFQAFPGIIVNYLEEGPSDIFLQSGGGQNRNAQPLLDFTWNTEHPWIETVWQRSYRVIRDVNVFLDNMEEVEFTETDKDTRLGEAKFLHAFSYYWLYGWFGPVPIVRSQNDGLFPERATDEEMRSFIENELIEAADLLPSTQADYGRITKGAALAALTKFYLNTRQWQKCANTAEQVMDLDIYSLNPDYTTMFNVQNERNAENIYVHPTIRDVGHENHWMGIAFPPDYPIESNQQNFAAQSRYFDSFVNSFDEDDERRGLFLTEYTNSQGEHVQLLGNDNSRSFKYYDENSNAYAQGNDFVIIRYADILLARAEALNELNGPNQESIDLINEIRNRAGLTGSDEISLGDFASKQELKNHILEERAWEFYSEAKRRTDLIRHGQFIEQAVNRGKNAETYHKLYPIPQSEIEANPNLEQNPEY